MKTLIINNHTKHITELEERFLNSVTTTREKLNEININDFELVVISGGSYTPMALNDTAVYVEEEKIIKSGIPIIGICLGCEIICNAFHGKLEKMPEQQHGEKVFEILDSRLKERLHAKAVKAYEAHGVRIIEVPTGFDVLIKSDHGPEMIKHKTLPIIGIQFHPEVECSDGLWEWVFEQEGFKNR